MYYSRHLIGLHQTCLICIYSPIVGTWINIISSSFYSVLLYILRATIHPCHAHNIYLGILICTHIHKSCYDCKTFKRRIDTFYAGTVAPYYGDFYSKFGHHYLILLYSALILWCRQQDHCYPNRRCLSNSLN